MLMSSPSVARWKSGGICSRVILPVSTSMTTRWSIAITVSPGSGNFETRSVGWPTVVLTRYISPTLRSSCCCVAIFFESGDHDDDRAIAAAPAGVVGGVAEVLDAVGRQLPLLACRDVAHPEIPVANEDAALAVGRHGQRLAVGGRASGGAAAATTAPAPATRRRIGSLAATCRRGAAVGAFRAIDIAAPSLPGKIEGDCRAVGGRRQALNREVQRIELRARRRGQRRRDLLVIERPRPCLLDRVDEDEFRAAGDRIPVTRSDRRAAMLRRRHHRQRAALLPARGSVRHERSHLE